MVSCQSGFKFRQRSKFFCSRVANGPSSPRNPHRKCRCLGIGDPSGSNDRGWSERQGNGICGGAPIQVCAAMASQAPFAERVSTDFPPLRQRRLIMTARTAGARRRTAAFCCTNVSQPSSFAQASAGTQPEQQSRSTRKCKAWKEKQLGYAGLQVWVRLCRKILQYRLVRLLR